VPSGIIANGFVDALREQRAKHKVDMRVAARMQAWVRGMLVRRARRDGRLERQVQAVKRRAPEPLREAVAAMLSGGGAGTSASQAAAKGRHKWFERLTVTLVALSAAAVVAQSDQSVVAFVGGTYPFDALELVVVLVFSVELLLRLWTAELVSNCSLSTAALVSGGGASWFGAARAYMTSFFGVVDVLAVLPFYVQLGLAQSGVHFDGSTFMVFRLLRVFELEHFILCFRLLGAVFASCAGVLRATGLLALCIWVGSATIFYCTERANPALMMELEDGAGEVPRFDNIPNSMYYVAIFMGGEWACMDFSKAGQVLQIFLCVVGIALYAIPVGTLFEAFGDVLAEKAEEGGDGADGSDEEDGGKK
jgi:hypothetical protein